MPIDTLPALYDHCVAVYREMDKEKEQDDEGNDVWEGSGTKLLNALGLSNPYYTNVMRALKAMDCVRQVRRGGGGQGSVWALMQAPTPALWRSHAAPVMKESQKESVQSQRDRDILHMITELTGRVEALEAIVNA